MIAGKAARMKVIVVPDELHFEDPRFSIADGKLKSLEDFDLNAIADLGN
jgi:mannitol-1-/sugar-/sorbitol-6-/2-deoxyglucose-6-phosphatase